MTYKYTTIENISRKLIGRLNLINEDLSVLYPTDNPTQSVDPILVETVVEEQENYLDLILGQIYNLPLQNKHPILTNIVDSLVIAELILVHFQGIQFGLGGDISGYGTSNITKAYNLLNALTAGYNIIIPMMMPVPPSFPGSIPQRRLELPGETLVERMPPSTLVNNRTVMNKLADADRSDYITEEELTDNPFSMDYEYNQEYET